MMGEHACDGPSDARLVQHDIWAPRPPCRVIRRWGAEAAKAGRRVWGGEANRVGTSWGIEGREEREERQDPLLSKKKNKTKPLPCHRKTFETSLGIKSAGIDS